MAERRPSDRSIFTVAVLAAFLGSWGSLQAQEIDLQELYQRGNAAETLEELETVVADLREAREQADTETASDYLQRLLAWTLNRRGEQLAERAAEAQAAGDIEAAHEFDQRALQDFEESVRLDASRWKPLHNRGVSRAMFERLEEALADFNRVIRMHPAYPNAWFNRGEIQYELGRFDDAVASYTEAIRLRPDDVGAYVSRGHAHFQAYRFQAALRDYSQAVQLNPNSADALTNRGDAYRSLGRWREAADDYRRAIDRDPELARAYQSAAWLMATCPDDTFRNAELGVQAAEKAIELLGTANYVYLDTLSAAYANAERFEEAVDAIEQAIEVAPDDQIERLETRRELFQSGRPYRQQARPRTASRQ